MNAEEMKQRATVEYAVRELNNVFESARKEKVDIRTSMSFCYSMTVYESETLDAISILCGTLSIDINQPFACNMVDKVCIASGVDPESYVQLDPETVLGWLEQIQEN